MCVTNFSDLAAPDYYFILNILVVSPLKILNASQIIKSLFLFLGKL